MYCVLSLKHVFARFMLDYQFLLSNKKLGRRSSKKIPGHSFFTVSRLKRLCRTNNLHLVCLQNVFWAGSFWFYPWCRYESVAYGGMSLERLWSLFSSTLLICLSCLVSYRYVYMAVSPLFFLFVCWFLLRGKGSWWDFVNPIANYCVPLQCFQLIFFVFVFASFPQATSSPYLVKNEQSLNLQTMLQVPTL